MVTTGLVALAVFYLFLVREPRKRILVLVLGLVLDLLLEPKRQAFHGNTWEHVLALGSGVGLAGGLGLAWAAGFNRDLRSRAWLYLKLAGIPPLAKAGTGWMSIMQQEHFGPVADKMAWAFESAWGFQPSVPIGRAMYWTDWTYALFSFIYVGLSAWISLSVLAWLRSGRRLDFEPFSANAVCGAIGCWFYFMVPLVGPQILLGDRFLHGNYPLFPSNLDWVGAPESYQRNGFPSLHAAWIFLVGAVLWPLGRRARAVAVFLVLTTLVGAIGYGTHYVLDLTAAVPLYYGARTLCSGLRLSNLVGALLQVGLLWGLGYAVLQAGLVLSLHPQLPVLIQVAVVALSLAVFHASQRLSVRKEQALDSQRV
jgi:hypothetical protein